VSVSVMQSLRQYLADAGLLDGYQVRFNRWSDADLEGAGNFVLFRVAGPGVSNRIQQRHDIDLYMVAEPESYVATQNTIEAVASYLRAAVIPPNAVRYSVPSNPTGPFEMTNGRQVFQLAVQVYTSSQVYELIDDDIDTWYDFFSPTV